MNKLSGMSAYLVGPIDACKEYGWGWRQAATLKLELYGVNVFNPTVKHGGKPNEIGEDIEKRKVLKQEGKYDELSVIMKEVRHFDLRMADKADFAIVYLDLDVFSCGTFEEIFWINRAKKPLITICSQTKAKIPDWLYACYPHQMMFDDFNSAWLYLDKVNSGDDLETYGRWIFF